ncbi:hypothetical protein HYH02_014443 [Chlamydomonas schloesseri]|nr:hypothetical protein HYH02_014443 [Chlamydomonas schloesseri]|eukprot:KAG2428094.1 hypothetical protein HYH02_014443 [Chlamydomonas schloesseri]
MQPTDLITMAVVKTCGPLAASTNVRVGLKTFSYTKNAKTVAWPVEGIFTSWEEKTAASFGVTANQLQNATKDG